MTRKTLVSQNEGNILSKHYSRLEEKLRQWLAVERSAITCSRQEALHFALGLPKWVGQSPLLEHPVTHCSWEERSNDSVRLSSILNQLHIATLDHYVVHKKRDNDNKESNGNHDAGNHWGIASVLVFESLAWIDVLVILGLGRDRNSVRETI